MTSDYQSGASAMQRLAAQLVLDKALMLGSVNLAEAVASIPLPADPANSEGTLIEIIARVHAKNENGWGDVGDVYQLKSDTETLCNALAARDAEIAALRAALEKAQSGWNSLNQSISYFSYDGSGVREALIAKRDEVYADSLRAAP